RLHRISVTDVTPRVESLRFEPGQAAIEARPRRVTRAVLVRRPVSELRVQRWADDEDIRGPAVDPLANRLEELLPFDRLVRHHEDPLTVRRCDDTMTSGFLAATAEVHRHRGGTERHGDSEPEPRVDDRPDRNQGERSDRQQ